MGGLPTPPEPRDVKEFIAELVRAGVSPRYAVWLGNRLPKYLWGFWRDQLSASGVSWPEFLRLMAGLEGAVAAWASGERSWDSLIGEISAKVSRGGRPSGGGLERWLGGKGK